MGSQMRTDVPEAIEHFIPEWHFLEDFKQKDEMYKKKQKQNYDTRNVGVHSKGYFNWG